MAALNTINNPVWGLGLQGYGYIVTGLTCIRQRIDIVLRTTKGSDPLRPLFGSDIYKWTDTPVNLAIPNIKKCIIDAVGLWVPDIKLKSITHAISIEHLFFDVNFTTKDGIDDSLQLFISNGGVITGDTRLVLQDEIPNNLDGAKYLVNMELDGAASVPIASPYGYENMDELFQWVQMNWGYLADWALSATRLIAYVTTAATSGKLILSLTDTKRIATRYPLLDSGEFYVITLYPTGISGEALVLEGDYLSTETALAAAQAQWAEYGTWRNEDNAGDFNEDFSDDFLISNTSLVLYTVTNGGALITITKT